MSTSSSKDASREFGKEFSKDFGKDFGGVSLSGLCVLHCLSLPVATSIAPGLQIFEDHTFHIVLAVSALIVAGFAFLTADSLRHARLPLLAAIGGLALIFFGAFFAPNETVERWVSVGGAILLAGAHVWRWLRVRPHAAQAAG